MSKQSINRSDLIRNIVDQQKNLSATDVELAIKTILQCMAEALANGDRIEIRGIGSFSVRARPARIGRNPKTGESIAVPTRRSVHFKPGKELRERVMPS
jgi:integration host factor subunit beta